MTDSVCYASSIFQRLSKLKFFQQKLQIFSNKCLFSSHLIPSINEMGGLFPLTVYSILYRQIVYSHPLDNNIPFCRCLRFSIPACYLCLCSKVVKKCQSLLNIAQSCYFNHSICYLPGKFHAEYEIDTQ